MKFTGCNNILSIYVNKDNLTPSAPWGPQLSPKGIKTQEACLQLKDLLKDYPENSVIAIRFHFSKMVSGKTTWYIEVRGRVLTDILKKEMSLTLTEPYTLSQPNYEKLLNILKEDKYRPIENEKTLRHTLKSKNIFIDG